MTSFQYCLTALLVVLWGWGSATAANFSTDYTVQVSATAFTTPPQLVFMWLGHSDSQRYTVYRKKKDSNEWGMPYAVLAGSATTYTDTALAVGDAYEYAFIRSALRDTIPYKAYGYIYAGIHAPAIEARGKILLLVERTVEDSLVPELSRLERDMRGDGWLVVRRSVARTETVPSVKALIRSIYATDSIRAVLLLGHIPVPYSGNINPDGHPDHLGAWPADVFYADLDGIWTDTEVRNDTTNGQPEANKNRAGDGKFDQNTPPSGVELLVGRVDMDNLPLFHYTEIELLRRYLDKNHAYRMGQFPVVYRGLVDDNFKDYREGFASNGWRNFAPMFGADHVDAGDFVPTTEPSGNVLLIDSFYQWSYGCGAGNFVSAAHVTHALHLASDTVVLRTVFTALFGSYFGDWNTEDNFMRSILAAPGYTLTCSWAGRPYWHFHHMALGETIGYSTRLTQNNISTYIANPIYPFVARWVSTALMGDPTLRMHVVAPPSGLVLEQHRDQRTVSFQWSPSSVSVLGYHIYRATDAYTPFQRLTTLPVADTLYTDPLPLTGDDVRYMVRAVALETSGSGTYYNLSQGVERAIVIEPFAASNEKVWLYPNPATASVTVEIRHAANATLSLEIIDVLGKRLRQIQPKPTGELTVVHVDISGMSAGTYFLRMNNNGEITEREVVVR